MRQSVHQYTRSIFEHAEKISIKFVIDSPKFQYNT